MSRCFLSIFNVFFNFLCSIFLANARPTKCHYAVTLPLFVCSIAGECHLHRVGRPNVTHKSIPDDTPLPVFSLWAGGCPLVSF